MRKLVNEVISLVGVVSSILTAGTYADAGKTIESSIFVCAAAIFYLTMQVIDNNDKEEK